MIAHAVKPAEIDLAVPVPARPRRARARARRSSPRLRAERGVRTRCGAGPAACRRRRAARRPADAAAARPAGSTKRERRSISANRPSGWRASSSGSAASACRPDWNPGQPMKPEQAEGLRKLLLVAGLRRAPGAAAARGPAGPHAQPQGCVRTRAAPRSARDARDLRAAREPPRHLAAQVGDSRTWRSATASPTTTSASPGWLKSKRAERERYIEDVKRRIERELEQAGIDGDVTGRPKHIYSIWRKMQRKRLAFEQVMDVLAVRIMVETVADCYAALGIVHGLWPYMPGEFDDYIATPKDNNYRSLHTAVIGPGKPAARSADPHARDARSRRTRRGGALALQGRPQGGDELPAEDQLAAAAAGAGHARRRRARPARRAAGRDVRGPGLRAEPEGRGRRPAARRHAARFRLPRAHEPRSSLPRRQGQRPHGAARTTRSRTATRSRSSPASSRTPAATGWCRHSASCVSQRNRAKVRALVPQARRRPEPRAGPADVRPRTRAPGRAYAAAARDPRRT